MKTDLDKYLIFRMSEDVGLDHVLMLVRGAIKEAIQLKRILVIEKYIMGGKHNLGHTLENLDIERYINLNKTRVYKVENNGSIKQINNTFRYIRAKDFDYNKYPRESVLEGLGDTPVSETQNNQYKVIVRRTNNWYYDRRLYPNALIIVAFHPSDKVVHLTDTVLRAMGTSLSDAEKLSAVHKGIDFAANKYIWKGTLPNNPLHYACLHARGNDMTIDPHFRQAASSSHIRSIVRSLLPKGTIIYLMTDIKKPGYLSFLEKDYTVYRYYDFPELKNLVLDGSSFDNAMLYSVEKNIMQHAYVKLTRNHQISRIIYTSCIHKVKWRYQVLSFIERLPLAISRRTARIKRLIGRV